MPIQVPLLNGGNIPLRQTGISVPRTARLEAGNPAIGRAVSQIGAGLGQLAEREQRANDARQMLEFETAMRAAEERQHVFQQENQDQDAWLPNWQTQEQELQKSLEGMKLSPDARLTLQSTLGRYVDNKRMAIRDQAVSQSEQRFKMGLGNRLMQAKTRGEVDTITSLVPSNMMSPEELERLRLQAIENAKQTAAADFKVRGNMARESFDGIAYLNEAQKAYDAEAITDAEFEAAKAESLQLGAKATFVEMAKRDPVIAKAKLKTKEFKELGIAGEDWAERYADGILRDYKTREKSDLADYITNGGDVDKFKFQWNIGDAEQAELRLAAKRPVIVTAEQAAVKRLEMEAKVGKYNMDADPDRKQMIAISAELDALKNAVPYAFSDLGTAWANKTKGKGPSLVEMDIADHDDYVQKLYKPKLEALLKKDGSIETGKEAEFRKLQSEATELKKKYRAQIGDNPTPEQARKTSQNILTLPTAENVTSYFDMLDANPILPAINAQPQPLNP